jgi:hypothetical protein
MHGYLLIWALPGATVLLTTRNAQLVRFYYPQRSNFYANSNCHSQIKSITNHHSFFNMYVIPFDLLEAVKLILCGQHGRRRRLGSVRPI